MMCECEYLSKMKRVFGLGRFLGGFKRCFCVVGVVKFKGVCCYIYFLVNSIIVKGRMIG